MSNQALEPQRLTDRDFQDFISGHDLVVVDYFADWCGPCQMMLPIYDELAGKMATSHPEITFAKINIDESRFATDEAGVMSVPTFIFYKNGEEVDRHIGGAAPQALQAFIEGNL